jgi:hypothetical protein
MGLLRRLGIVVVFVASLFAFDRLIAGMLASTPAWAALRSNVNRRLVEARKNAPYPVLVFGTSRTFEGIHPADILEKTGARAFKEAFQGKGPRYNYEFYQRFRRFLGKPRVVVYGVDYFVFALKSERPLDNPIAGAGGGRLEWPLLLVRDKALNDRAIVIGLQGLQNAMAPRGDDFNPERYQADMETYRGSDGPRRGDPPAPEPRRYDRNPFRRPPGDEGVYFEKLLTELESDGVVTLLVGLPDFIATYRTNFEQERWARTISEIASHHRNCFFVNYDDPARFPLDNPDYFIDGQWGNGNSHMSRVGVQALLPALTADLKKALDASPHQP